MDAFKQDLLQALRMPRRSPGFALVAVLTLGIGIGANTAIYSFIYGLLVRPFPFEGLGQIVTLWETRPIGQLLSDAHSVSGSRVPVSAPAIEDWKAVDALESIEAYRYLEFSLTGPKGPEWEQGVEVTPGFFNMLRVKPLLGRTFAPGDDQPEKAKVCLVSHALWQRFFHSDPNVVGQPFDLNYGSLIATIVGVLPENFEFPMGGVRIYVPMMLKEGERTDRGSHILFAMGRMRDGYTAPRTLSALQPVMARIAREHPATSAGWGVSVLPLRQVQAAYTTPFAVLFEGAAIFVLLIACANVANLLLARANGRRKEMAVRVSLGATRGQVVRQLLTENLLLGLCAGALGIFLGWRGVEMIRTTVPDNIQWFTAGWKEIRVNWSALTYATLLAVVTTLLFGLVPALQASKVDLNENLKDTGRGTRGGPVRRRLGNLLVIGEVALALVLLVGSALMVRGFRGLENAYKGYDPDNVISMRVNLPPDVYTQRAQLVSFYTDVLKEVKRSVPEAKDAAFVTNIVGSLRGLTSGAVEVDEGPFAGPDKKPGADLHSVTPSYFHLIQMPLVKGRPFSDSDGPDNPPVCIVSQALADRFWPGQEPLGKRIKIGVPIYMSALHPSEAVERKWSTVVGVAPNQLQYWIDKEPRSAIFLPAYQVPRREMSLLLRTDIGNRIVDPGRKAILAVDKTRPAYGVRTAAEVINTNLTIILVFSGLMGVFGLVALFLSALGVYGLMAYQVSERTQEVGIRMALGAGRGRVMMMVLRQSGWLLAVGLAIGLPVAMMLNRVMARFLYGVGGFNFLSLVAVAVGLAAVGVMACWVPAWRASTVQPVDALRYE